MSIRAALLATFLWLPADASAQPSLVVFVRPAERAAAPTNDPVLTDAGAQRARDLRDALAGAGVTAVVTTHLQRTILTAKPLGDTLRISPIVVRAGGPAHVDSVAATVRQQSTGAVVLVVGHSNTIPAIVGALGGPKLSDLCENQYSTMYILEFPTHGPPHFIRANYGAPDPAGASECLRATK